MIKGISEINNLPVEKASLELQKVQVVLSIILLGIITYTAFIQDKK